MNDMSSLTKDVTFLTRASLWVESEKMVGSLNGVCTILQQAEVSEGECFFWYALLETECAAVS